MQVRKLWSRLNEAILVWPGEQPIVIKYDADEIWVPPRFETAVPGPTSPYRLPSARSKSGTLIRGTTLVKDVAVETPTGGYQIVFDVQAMAQYLIRDRDDLFQRGFNIVSTPDEVLTAMDIGLPLYEASQDLRAREVVAKEMTRRKKFEDKGEPPPPSSSEQDVMWAIAHLRSRDQARPKFSDIELRQALEGRYTVDAPPATIPLSTTSTGQDLYAEAKALRVQLSKTELEAIMNGDEAQMVFVRQKIRLKRDARLEQRLDSETEAHEGDPAE